jgi:hypothetical protein
VTDTSTRRGQRSFIVALTTFALTSCSPVPTDSSSESSTQKSEREQLASFDAVDAIEIVESPATGVALGWGWNRGDSEPVPTICIEFVPGEEPAQTRYMTMQEVSDSYTLMKSLGVSAEASVKAIGYEVSGKAAFAKSTNLSSERSTFVMNAIVQNGVRYAAPVPIGDEKGTAYQPAVNERGGSRGAIRLTADALKLAQKHDGLMAFKHQCGSAFVSAIYGGAKLTAAISFSSSSLQEKESLSAELSGSGWGARFKGKVDEAKTEGKSSQRMDISIFMTGGKGDAIPASKEDLLAKLETISLDAYVAPKDFQLAITPYEVLSNWPGKLLPDKETEFDELASYWGSYNTLYDEMQEILDHPKDYYLVESDVNGCPVIPKCTAEREAYISTQQTLDQLEKNLAAIPGWKEAFVEIGKPLTVANESARATLKKCEAGFNLTTTEQSSASLASLKRAQDEVLVALRRLQDEARECSDRSDNCSFEASHYRSPYAFRIQLPVPVSAALTSADEITDYHVGRPAKQRCEFSPSDPGCLSNGQIDQWQRKLGYIPVNKAVQPQLYERYAEQARALQAKFGTTAQPATTGCANPYLFEEGYGDVVWYNPSYQTPEPKPSAEAEKGNS